MTARPAWVRKLWTFLAFAAVAVLAAAGWLWLRLTEDAALPAFKEPNRLDAEEAVRKLNIYKGALAEEHQGGFIRLSELELNSYLQYSILSETNQAELSAGEARLVDGHLRLFSDSIEWYCWVRKPWLGTTADLMWQRTLQPRRSSNSWTLAIQSMSVGSMEIPESAWPYVLRQLSAADRVFREPLAWLNQLPALEIKFNEMTSSGELVLYTMPASETRVPAKP